MVAHLGSNCYVGNCMHLFLTTQDGYFPPGALKTHSHLIFTASFNGDTSVILQQANQAAKLCDHSAHKTRADSGIQKVSKSSSSQKFFELCGQPFCGMLKETQNYK